MEGGRVAGLSDVAAPLGGVANEDEEVASFAGWDERVELKGLVVGATVEAMSMVEGMKGLASTLRAEPTAAGNDGGELVDRAVGGGMVGELFKGLED